jgi:hypothetical protein
VITLGQRSHSSLGPEETKLREPEEGSQRPGQPERQRYRHKEPGSKPGPERSKPERSSSERSNRSSGEHADEPTGRSNAERSSS